MSKQEVFVCDVCGVRSDEPFPWGEPLGFEDVCSECTQRIQEARQAATRQEVARIQEARMRV